MKIAEFFQASSLVTALILIVALGSACGPAEVKDENTIRIGFAPSEDSEIIQEEAKNFAALLEKKTGYKVKVNVLPNYATMVASLQSDHLDFAWLPPLTFVQAEKNGAAEVLLKVVRNNNPYYYGAIVVRTDSDIQNVEELEGKSIAWGDITSFSGHIFPKYSLIKKGIYKKDFFSSERHMGNHHAVLVNVINGQVDAGACFSNSIDGSDGAWTQLLKDAEDQKKIRVILYTDPIPGDTFSVRSAFKKEFPEKTEKIAKIIQNLTEDPEGKGILFRLYHIDRLDTATSQEYDIVRSATAEVLKD